MGDADATLAARRAAVFRDLALDALALRAIDALRRAGIEVLLMKGPVTRSWLYGSDEHRAYTDVDLLVSPAAEQEAASVMRALGFRDLHALDLKLYKPPSERAWLAPDGVVDLHVGLVGVPDARWGRTWTTVTSRSEHFLLRGHQVEVMDPACRAFHLALHAAQKASGAKARRDLELACRSVPLAVWLQAAEVARELDAQAAFAAGLRGVTGGARILDELELPRSSPSTLTLLHARGAPAEALALAHLWALPRGVRAAAVLDWFRFEQQPVSRMRAWRLRAAAISRFPAAFQAWFTAAGLARAGQR
jgi:hypothetical protein